MVLFGYKEEGRESCLARKTFWEMKTAVTSGCTGIEQKFPLAHEGLNILRIPNNRNNDETLLHAHVQVVNN